MKEKDLDAKKRIIDIAKIEFMNKGFLDASMRTIADKCGFTTGMVYTRFKDKNDIFNEIVCNEAEHLFNYYLNCQKNFTLLEARKQDKEMHGYTNDHMVYMIDYIYEHFDVFKLVVCKSKGSMYEDYIDRFVEVETKSTFDFIGAMRKANLDINDVSENLNHMLASAMFNCLFEIVRHDFSKEEAINYVNGMELFFHAGWDKILKNK